MQILHDSMKRTLQGAVLCGTVTTVREQGPGETSEFACLVESLTKHSVTHRWDLDLVLTPGGNGVPFSIPVRIEWAGSVPVISASHIDTPTADGVSFRVMIYNSMFAGTWHDGDRVGQVYGRLQRQEQPHTHKRYTIERSSECMHDWWSGTDWSDNPADAKWYQHEPCGAAETHDEDARTVYHGHGNAVAP